jgi:hypothetical protein
LNLPGPGAVAGYYFDTAGFVHGFLLRKGKFKTISIGATNTFGVGVSSADYAHVVGMYETNGVAHGFKA